MTHDPPQPSPQPNVADAMTCVGFPARFWLLVIVIGVGVGLAGASLMLLLHAVGRLAWHLAVAGTLLDAVQQTSPARRVLNLTIAGAWVGAAGLLLRRVFGSRGGDVDAAIWFHCGRVSAIPTMARSVASIVAVGLGMSLGREAAIKQAGGAIASRLARWADVPPAHRRLLVASGVGAGMAAAYNVPLGGALFALEVLLGTVSMRLVLPAVTMSVVATATSWIALPQDAIYDLRTPALTASATVWALVAGPIFGLIAVALIRLIAWAGTVRPRGVAALVAPVVTLSLLGVASIRYPQLLGNGQDAVQVALDGKLTLGLLLVLPSLKAIATAACLAAGGRGGLFTPTLMVGATAGGLLGHAWSLAWPGGVDPGLAALIGAAAVLAAASQGPVSSIVLVLELTRHGDSTMVPILLATLGATFTAARLEPRSLYSARVATTTPVPRPDWPGVEWQDAPAVVPATADLAVVTHLLMSPADAVYVVDEAGQLLGTITPADVDPAHYRPMPADAVAAADLARSAEPITDPARASATWQPIVTHDSRLVGIARRQP